MATDDGHRTVSALQRLRQRWFSPSRPLAVDDVPHWHPPADPEGEPSERDSDADGSAPAAATP